MNTLLRSIADGSAPAAVEVRNHEGELLRTVPPGKAATLVQLGWAEWTGRGSRRYLKLTNGAPAVRRPGDFRGPGTTQRIRDAKGAIIAPDFHLEHKPLP